MNSDHLLVSVADANFANALGEIKGAEVVVWDMTGPPPVLAIDIVIPPYFGVTTRTAQLAQVTTRLVQGPLIGYEGTAGALPPGIVFANSASVQETSTAEMTLGPYVGVATRDTRIRARRPTRTLGSRVVPESRRSSSASRWIRCRRKGHR
jgi:hypothetical protein